MWGGLIGDLLDAFTTGTDVGFKEAGRVVTGKKGLARAARSVYETVDRRQRRDHRRSTRTRRHRA